MWSGRNYLKQPYWCWSPLKLWDLFLHMTRYIPYISLWDKICQWSLACRWFSPSSLIFSTNKTDSHDITEILLKVVFNSNNLVFLLLKILCLKLLGPSTTVNYLNHWLVFNRQRSVYFYRTDIRLKYLRNCLNVYPYPSMMMTLE